MKIMRLLTSLLLLLLVLTPVTAQVPSGPQPVAQPVTVASCNFTRPADTTAYASGDLVANSVTAGSVVPCTLTIARTAGTYAKINRASISFNDTTLTNAQFRLHFFSTCTITLANGDNGVFSPNSQANWLGAVDVTVDQAFTAAAKQYGTPNKGTEMISLPATGTRTLCVLVEARAAYVPTSAEVFTITAQAVLN